jgi:hypothetical protein
VTELSKRVVDASRRVEAGRRGGEGRATRDAVGEVRGLEGVAVVLQYFLQRLKLLEG